MDARTASDVRRLPAPPPPRWLLAVLAAATLLPRLVAYPLNENLYGDAASRTELALKWARAPHWISSFQDGAMQFGPLHVYLVGIASWVWPSPNDAGRAVSLLFGVLTLVPLYGLTRRLFGWKAAAWACLGLAVWGVHIQLSTSAASEALSIFLALCALWQLAEAVAENRVANLAWAALAMNLAMATRYDAWLLVPLLCLALLFSDEDRAAGATRAVLFGLFCLPFPLIWLHGNEIALGSPLYPIHFIDEFHRRWTGEEVARIGELRFRRDALFFWPACALLTLTPPIALCGMAGMIFAWRSRPKLRWLIACALVPAAYLTFRSAVLLRFTPLLRFATPEIALLLPFVEPGFRRGMGWASPRLRAAAVGLSAALAVAAPVSLGAFTFRQEGSLQDMVRPLSPVATNPPEMMEVARYFQRPQVPKDAVLLLDEDETYRDIQVGFFSGIPSWRQVRFRWKDYAERYRERRPTYAVRFDGGKLASSPGVSLAGPALRIGDAVFEEVPGFAAPYHVYFRR